MDLVIASKAINQNWWPYTMTTTHKKSAKGELPPGVIIKLGNKLYIDKDAWMKFCEKEQKRQMEITKRKQSGDTP